MPITKVVNQERNIMGLSSNARLLSITARLTSNEYESQQISNSKMRLAAQSQEASQNYLAALGDEQLVFMGYTPQGFETINNLTAALLYTFGDNKNQYGIVNNSGQLLIDKEDALCFQNSATLDVFLENNGIEKIWSDKTIQEYYELYTSEEYQGYKAAWQEVCNDVSNAELKISYVSMDSVVPKFSTTATASTSTTTKEVTESFNDAWEFVYQSSHTQLSEIAKYYNECVKKYNDATGEKIPQYEINYKSNEKLLTQSVTEITYAVDNNTLGIFTAGYDTNNIKADNSAQKTFNTNISKLTSATSDAEDAKNSAIEYIENIYSLIIKAEQSCRECETKNAFIENIAKSLNPIETNESKYLPKFTFDETAGTSEEKQWEEYLSKYQELYKKNPLQYYERTAGDGATNSTIYQNYQKYLELETELSYMLEDYGATLSNPSNAYTYSDISKFKWYTNLWYKMNGESTRKSNEGTNAHNYKVLDKNLLQSSTWLQDSLRNGTVSLELASNFENLTMDNLFDVSNILVHPNDLTLKNIKWSSKIYTSCSDITTTQDKTKVARAEAEYERRTQEISAKDQKYQNTLKKLETEHSALQTEYESVQNALEKNIDRSFKTFNG